VIHKRGFVVFHPDSMRLLVNLEYRQYYGRGVQPLTMDALEHEVEPFQQSLTFTVLQSTQKIIRQRNSDEMVWSSGSYLGAISSFPDLSAAARP
jgi:hypothetical protein